MPSSLAAQETLSLLANTGACVRAVAGAGNLGTPVAVGARPASCG